MGLLAILPFTVAALLILGQATSGSDNFVVESAIHVSAQRGSTATLPCWLSPAQSAEALEVLWYHNNDVDSPLILSKGKMVSSPPSYANRASFGPHGAASGSLASGNLSLELVNVTLQDSGEYTCYVSSDHNHDSATVTLAVTETGRPLRLSAVWTDADVVNVSCGSRGWYPRPYLRWWNQKGPLTPAHVQYGEESSGLVSVHGWVLVPSSSEFTCTVGLQGGEERESRLHLSNLPQTGQRDSHNSASATAGLAALAVLLAIATAILGIAFYKLRERKIKSQEVVSEMEEAPEEERLLPKATGRTSMSEAKKNYVNIRISIPEDKHPFLSMRDTEKTFIVREKSSFPKGSKVSCLTAITGRPGFSSGEHYWEVSLAKDQVGVKTSWWLGVTDVGNVPQNDEVSATATKGYWFLSSSSEDPDFLELSTEPAALLPVASKPHTVGVFLSCERGEVTFYNVDNSSVIGSLKVDFKGEVFPFFNPGLFDLAPMEILRHNTSNEEAVAPDP